MCYTKVEGAKVATLADTGCTKSCLSEAFLRKHTKLYKRYFRPMTKHARSIDGSKVLTVGIINISFRVGKQYKKMNFRVVRNLIHEMVLGWDFFVKYDAQLFARDGYLSCEGEKIDLIEDTSRLGGAQYAMAEDMVIPPSSKAQFTAALLIDSAELSKVTSLVCLEPKAQTDSDICTARSICRVNGGNVLVEAINPFDHPIKIPEGTVLGYAEFMTEEELDATCEFSGMEAKYETEDSAYETGDESRDESGAALSSDDDAENGTSSKASTRLGSDQKSNMAAGVDSEEDTAAGTDSADASEDSEFEEEHLMASQENPERDKKDDAFKIDFSKMAPEAKVHEKAIKHLFEVKHAKVVAKHERDYGRTTLTQHHARLIDKTPVALPPYRTDPERQKIIDETVHEMVADGLLSHSTSAYSAPILLVPKKEPGKWRLVTDFRRVNAATQKVIYPLPRIEDALHRLKNPRFFTSLDLVKGFWQVPIAEEDRHIYAFSTGTGHVQYNVMPMGAKNSTSTLQALMALLLRGLPAEHVVAFLDDILVASSTIEEHIEHLDKVLTALGRANLKLHPRKCAVARESALCLGHLLDANGIRPDPSNLAKVVKWPVPSNVKEVRGFLSLTGYYRMFIQNYAKVAEPLTNLTSKEKNWSWGTSEQEAFEFLRAALVSEPIVAYPDFEKPFWIKTDASGGSIGYVLTQFVDNKERVIAYGSKKLDATQRRWSTYDREFYGLLIGIRSNSHYLRVKRFSAVTDHRPLLAWRKQDAKKDVTGRRMRWIIELESYDFELIYRQGRVHSDADALSRLPNDEDYASDVDTLEGLKDDEAPDRICLLGMDDPDVESAVKYTCLGSYLKRLKAEQDAEPTISDMKRFVRARKKPPRSFESWYRKHFSRFMLKNGILYMKRFEPLTDLVSLRAVVPQSLVQEILNDAHGSMLAGHPGSARMAAKLEKSVCWDGLSADVKKHVQKCKQCDLVRQQNPPVRVPLEPVVAKRVGDHVICDLLKLPTTPGNFNYVLVCMDIFSKYVNLYKLRTKEAPGVASAILDMCLSRGFPKKLGTDNGAEFDNHILNSAAKLMGVEKATSVVYRPQSQGAVERHNRQIIAELQKRLEQYGKSWADHLPFVQYAYNSTPHSKTGESPFKVVFGREPPLPNFEEVDIDHHRDKSVRQYVKDLQKRLETIHSAVRERAKKKSQQEKERYDKRTKHIPLTEGELVYEKENVRPTKLTPKWKREPVKVVKRCKSPKGSPGHTYVVERRDGSQHRRNLEQLKPALADFSESKDPKRVTPLVKPTAVPLMFDSDDEADRNLPPIVRVLRSRTIRQPMAPVVDSQMHGLRPIIPVATEENRQPEPVRPVIVVELHHPVDPVDGEEEELEMDCPSPTDSIMTVMDVGELVTETEEAHTMPKEPLSPLTLGTAVATQGITANPAPAAPISEPVASTSAAALALPAEPWLPPIQPWPPAAAVEVLNISSGTPLKKMYEVTGVLSTTQPPSTGAAVSGLPPIPPGRRSRSSSVTREEVEDQSQKELSSPRAVRSSSSATPIKIRGLDYSVSKGACKTPVKGKTTRGQKTKSFRSPSIPDKGSESAGISKALTDADQDPEYLGEEQSKGEKAANRSIYNFAQFLRHSAISPKVPTAKKQQKPKDTHPVASPNQTPYQPITTVNDGSDSGGRTSQEEYNTADEGPTEEDESTPKDQPTVAVFAIDPKPIQTVDLPGYNLRRTKVRSKRGSKEMEPPIESPQLAKLGRSESHYPAWIKDVKTAYTPEGAPMCLVRFFKAGEGEKDNREPAIGGEIDEDMDVFDAPDRGSKNQ